MNPITQVTAAAAIALAMALPSMASDGRAPDPQTCRNPGALATADVATQGGCLVIHRRKGNCQACHVIAGTASGDIAPPLASVAKRFPDKRLLRAKIEDARQSNPDTVMPPFGAHRILTSEEIDKVLEFLLTL